MKFVHIADIHFDCPFTVLGGRENLGDIRRLEQRKIFKKIINYIKENNVDYLFIAGDLYEHNYIRKSTIDFINSLFSEISQTQIFITPGNHDPYLKNSYYETYNWSPNVYIQKEEAGVYSDDNIDVYLTSFNDFYMSELPIENIKIQNKEKTNILITHCDLNGSKDENGFSYNPLLESKIKALNFDYVAMGHIHKSNYEENKNIIYPGSPISFGFDEPGEHGMVVGEINNKILYTEFIKLDDRIFTKYELCMDNVYSQEELIEQIYSLRLDKKNMYEIVLVGNRNFEINIINIQKFINIENVLKIKDNTKIGYDIEKIAQESSFRGIFVREVIKKYETVEYTEEQIKKAIEIGLEAINN